MRTIDVDKLVDAMTGACNIFDAHGVDTTIARTLITIADKAPTVGEWISVESRLPVETHSIFWRFHGTEKWSSAMWKEQSDKVLVTVAFKDGTKLVTTGETHDGVWHTTISRTLEPEVTHWMPLPEPPKEVSEDG